ncbi:MAG: phosphatase [Flammeovirgaceae bacterium]
MKAAVLDLGTNTFNLLIAEQQGTERPQVLFRERRFVKIGQGGISQGVIAADAYERALAAMIAYSKIIQAYAVNEVVATATSAIRSAQNGAQLLADIQRQAGILPQTISGVREAEIIFEGVKADIGLGTNTSLVMDIGGGSVEFVMGNEREIFWRQSFEIGAQRLYDRFHRSEPIAQSSIEELEHYLEQELSDLLVAIKKYEPQLLIGSSGTFDTIWDVLAKPNGERQLSYEEFLPIHQLFIGKKLEERRQIKGMLVMRAEMIVVASCLLDFVFRQLPHKLLKISNAALKEGVLALIFAGKSI